MFYLYGITVTDRRPVHGKAADKILSVLPCRNGGVPSLRLYQYLLCRTLRSGYLTATAEIAPVVEEVMKLLPLLFYLLVFEPKPEQIKISAAITALSFATFENICYLIQTGAGHFSFIFPGHWNGCHARDLRSHCRRRPCVCVAADLAEIAGTCGLLGAAITFHALYNLLIAYGGAVQYAAYVLPVMILAAGKLIASRLTS